MSKRYFGEKEILSFLIIQERLYSSANFLERSSFRNIWKKSTMVFFDQCIIDDSEIMCEKIIERTVAINVNEKKEDCKT